MLATEGAGGGFGAWLFGTAALAIATGLAYAVGTLRARRSAEAALREARQDRQLLQTLADGWIWRSDEAHRLLGVQAPHSAPPPAWGRVDGERPLLWDCFVDDDGAAGTPPAAGAPGDGLRARLLAQLPFGDLRVRRRDDGSGWLLRAAPRFDALGRFAGFVGSAAPTDADDARRADQRALAAWLQAQHTPVVVAGGDGQPERWRLRHANPAAERFFEAPAARLDWPGVLARLPSPMRNAVAEARSDGDAEHEGWRLRRFSGPDGAGLLLLKLPSADAEDSASEAAAFSFTVSHDLRAPVRVVEGFTRILKEDYGRLLDRVGNDHLDRVLGAAARMNQMIDALLALARLSQQPLARQPVNLSQLAAYVVDDLRRQAPERAAEIEIQPGLVTNGDPTLLRQVLENLLGNAWKYSAKTKKAHLVFRAEPHERGRAFVVRDNGAGFDMRSADRLFGLFQRLHAASDFAGTGVGLASVRRIVRRHGGEVWADAEPGRGAAFFFTVRE